MKRITVSLLVLALLGTACQPEDILTVGDPTGDDSAQLRIAQVPASIDSTGSTDVSEQMAAFIASEPDGAVIEFAPDGRYRMEQTLLVEDRHDLTFVGNGAEIFATSEGDRNRQNIRVRNGSDITFRDLTVTGANPDAGKDGTFRVDLEAQHAFDVGGTVGFTLDDVVATDTYGDFVHLGHLAGIPTRGAVIRNSTFERSGRHGITFFGVRDVRIEGNSLTSMRRATFDFEPASDDTGSENVVIRRNTVGPGRLNFVSAAGHGPVNNVTIEGNQLVGQAMQVFLVNRKGGRRSNWKIIDNTSDLPINNPHLSVMRIWRVDGLEIRGNRQPVTKDRGMYGASIDSSCDVAADGNDYPNAVGQAIITNPC